MAQKHAQPAGTTEHIPSSEQHAKGFPPFDATTFASQLLWLVLTFVALYLLMSRVALPRVGAIIENRRQRVAGDLADAQRFKDQSDSAIAAYEKALAEARGRAQTLANETREKQAAAAEAHRKSLDVKLNAHIAEAEKTIASSRSAAMTNVRTIAADAAAAIVERLTGSAPAKNDVADAVGDVLKR
jgi:F-type H+-transporting ATPase subunit b